MSSKKLIKAYKLNVPQQIQVWQIFRDYYLMPYGIYTNEFYTTDGNPTENVPPRIKDLTKFWDTIESPDYPIPEMINKTHNTQHHFDELCSDFESQLKAIKESGIDLFYDRTNGLHYRATREITLSKTEMFTLFLSPIVAGDKNTKGIDIDRDGLETNSLTTTVIKTEYGVQYLYGFISLFNHDCNAQLFFGNLDWNRTWGIFLKHYANLVKLYKARIRAIKDKKALEISGNDDIHVEWITNDDDYDDDDVVDQDYGKKKITGKENRKTRRAALESFLKTRIFECRNPYDIDDRNIFQVITETPDDKNISNGVKRYVPYIAYIYYPTDNVTKYMKYEQIFVTYEGEKCDGCTKTGDGFCRVLNGHRVSTKASEIGKSPLVPEKLPIKYKGIPIKYKSTNPTKESSLLLDAVLDVLKRRRETSEIVDTSVCIQKLNTIVDVHKLSSASSCIQVSRSGYTHQFFDVSTERTYGNYELCYVIFDLPMNGELVEEFPVFTDIAAMKEIKSEFSQHVLLSNVSRVAARDRDGSLWVLVKHVSSSFLYIPINDQMCAKLQERDTIMEYFTRFVLAFKTLQLTSPAFHFELQTHIPTFEGLTGRIMAIQIIIQILAIYSAGVNTITLKTKGNEKVKLLADLILSFILSGDSRLSNPIDVVDAVFIILEGIHFGSRKFIE